MARKHPHRHCKGCGASRELYGRLSAIGLCPVCGDARMTANVEGLRAHSGPVFRRWREGMAASVGARLLDSASDEA